MTEARLSISLPDGIWIADISTAHPEATFRVLAAMPGEEAGFGLVRVTGPDLAGITTAMRAADDLTALSVLRRNDRQALIQFETTQPLLLLSARESHLPIEFPVEIEDGIAVVDVTAPRERLSELGEQLRAFGLSFDVEYIREGIEIDRLLSERQREVLFAAVERGYYATPRRCSLTDLADGLGIAKSTCSETLHRAEGAVIEQFVAELSDSERR